MSCAVSCLRLCQIVLYGVAGSDAWGTSQHRCKAPFAGWAVLQSHASSFGSLYSMHLCICWVECPPEALCWCLAEAPSQRCLGATWWMGCTPITNKLTIVAYICIYIALAIAWPVAVIT